MCRNLEEVRIVTEHTGTEWHRRRMVGVLRDGDAHEADGDLDVRDVDGGRRRAVSCRAEVGATDA